VEIYIEQEAITFHRGIDTHVSSVFDHSKGQTRQRINNRINSNLLENIKIKSNHRAHQKRLLSKERLSEERSKFPMLSRFSSFLLKFLVDEVPLRSYEESIKKTIET